MPFPAQTNFDDVMGCLRLSHKYEFDYLRRRALIHMSSGYTTQLSRWDRIVALNRDIDEDTIVLSETPSWLGPDIPAYKISVIQVVREVGALWLLPLAFYTLSAAFTELGRDIYHGVNYNNSPVSLSADDQERCARGHAIQSHTTTTDILRFLYNPLDIQGCTTPMECYRERLAAFETIREMIPGESNSPLEIWHPEDWETLADICSTCLAVLKTSHQNDRQAFWDKLPEIYDLPPWEELERMKIEAIGTEWFF